MSPIVLTVIFALAALTLALAFLRLRVSRELDALITQCGRPETGPLDDITVAVTVQGAGMTRQYTLRPTRRGRFVFILHSEHGRVTYRLGRWGRHPGVMRFLSVFLTDIPCRSAWFVRRMERLTHLVDAYPRAGMPLTRTIPALES